MKRIFYVLGLFALVIILIGCNNGAKSTFALSGHTYVKLYFPENGKIALKTEEIVIPKVDALSTAKLVLKELWSKAAENGLTGLFPKHEKEIAVSLHSSTAVIDLPKEIQDKHIGGTTAEMLTVYSIVNTVTSVEGIDSVKFLIDGKIVDSFKGHLDFASTFSAQENV